MPLIVDSPAVPELLRNDLAYLQLEIARRADQLARLVVTDRATDIALWLQAEAEVFARHLHPAEYDNLVSIVTHSQRT